MARERSCAGLFDEYARYDETAVLETTTEPGALLKFDTQVRSWLHWNKDRDHEERCSRIFMDVGPLSRNWSSADVKSSFGKSPALGRAAVVATAMALAGCGE